MRCVCHPLCLYLSDLEKQHYVIVQCLLNSWALQQYRQIAEENSGFYNTINSIFREQKLQKKSPFIPTAKCFPEIRI